MSDGELRTIFKQYMPEAMWVPVETWSTGIGVPDVHYCFPSGLAGWVENKLTSTYAVDVQPGQVGWLERYSRKGGRCFVAVRRKTTAGPRKGKAVDELWICRGSDVRLVATDGLKIVRPLAVLSGSPSQWDWTRVKKIFTA